MAYQELPPLGRAGEDDSLPVVLSTEDQALLQELQTQLTDVSTATKQDAQTALLTTLVNRLASGGTVAATEAKQTAHQSTLDAIQAKIIAAPATEAKQDTIITELGAINESAPVTDTAPSGLNARLQRIAQRITSLIAAIGSPFQTGDSIGNTAFGVNNGAGGSAVNIQDGGNSITVDGTVSVSGVAQDSTLTGGSQKAIVRGGAKGSTTAADVTSTAGGSNRQMLDVILRDSSGNEASIGGGGGGTGTTVVDDIGVMVKQSLDMLRHPPYMGPTGHVRVEIGVNGQAVTVSSGTLNIPGMGSAAIDQSFTAWQTNNINFQLYKNRVYGY